MISVFGPVVSGPSRGDVAWYICSVGEDCICKCNLFVSCECGGWKAWPLGMGWKYKERKDTILYECAPCDFIDISPNILVNKTRKGSGGKFR